MGKSSKSISVRQGLERILILSFCMFVTISVISVLFLVYEPGKNTLAALASVCLDVMSLIVLVLLTLNFAFAKGEISRTTGWFLGLMIATMWAVFMDFMTWSSDGALTYDSMSYVYTVLSLCMGSILAAIFVLYLSSYLDDMYGLKSAFKYARIMFALNMISFVVTAILAFTHQAFELVDGHYTTGTLYDIITAIPVLTLIFMTGYAIRHVKFIGVHDVIAVVGYIAIMICGTMIEAANSIGTTYVSLTIADIFIFVMLQNKLIDRANMQKEQLSEQITSQYNVLDSMAGIYSYVNYIDLEAKTARRFGENAESAAKFETEGDSHSSLNKRLYEGLEKSQKEKFLAYTDLATLADRMNEEKIITAEFCNKEEGWFRAQYIRIGDATEGPAKKVIYAIRNIDEEKKNVEKWIRKSNTDELTGFYNRHAYEEEIARLEKRGVKENFVYVSIDVNSLKLANDSLGHDAGDELLVGACECMKQCFGSYGKLFRTGGDEFAALLFADETQLEEIKNDIDEVTAGWKGILNDTLTISCGYVSETEMEELSIRQMAVLADKRMYEEKNRYYKKKGIDRRGQRDAHVALCELYTKILKINITDNSYQIVNMNEDEKTKEKGFSGELSQWLFDFGTTGQVHPEDLEDYLSKTSLDYLSNYFKRDKSSLKVFYRRKNQEGQYNRVMLEMIPATDYSDDMQTLFLYVKCMD